MGQASLKENKIPLEARLPFNLPICGFEMRDTTAIHSLALLVIPACCHSGRGEKWGGLRKDSI